MSILSEPEPRIALHRASEMGAEKLVRVLLEAGADPYADAEGHTPVSLAKSRNLDAKVVLLEKGSENL
ncbi:MAG: ankyrin repeat domain-containing protein [Verrucomicrobiales bacterium]|nr:ankyrin repeat domain-containing protein [Verrucomicrobiales bacterium]